MWARMSPITNGQFISSLGPSLSMGSVFADLNVCRCGSCGWRALKDLLDATRSTFQLFPRSVLGHREAVPGFPILQKNLPDVIGRHFQAETRHFCLAVSSSHIRDTSEEWENMSGFQKARCPPTDFIIHGTALLECPGMDPP